jgi:hypothetical protein
MTTRINAKAETALRKAMAAVAGLEVDQIEPVLGVLDEKDLSDALALAVLITGYVAVDSCGTEWPTQHSIRRIAEDLATTGTVSRELQIDTGNIYQYLSRVVLGSELLEDMLNPEESEFMRFPVIVAQRATSVYCPREIEIWDYVDQIESAIEVAWTLQSTVLTATVLRSYLPLSKSGVRLRGRQ